MKDIQQDKPFYDEPGTVKQIPSQNFFSRMAGWVRGIVNPAKMEIRDHSPYQHSPGQDRTGANHGK